MLLFLYLIATVLLLTTAPLAARPVSAPHSPTPPTSAVHRRLTRGVTPKNVVLWPNGIVPFEIDNSLLRAKGNIRDAMNQFMQKSCVHFQPRTNETAYLHLTKNDACSSSFIGYSGGRQVISLAAGCQSMGIITHELGHALGLAHEHTRSDRQLFVTIHTINIKDYNRQDIRAQFAISLSDRNLTAYDYDSITGYGNYAFTKDDRKETITAVNDVRLLNPGQKSRLSELDVYAVNYLYNCADNKKK